MAKFDEGLFGSARFDSTEYAQLAADILSLADALTRRAQLANADALSVTDQMSKAARAVFGDAATTADAAIPRSLVLFQDAVDLADGILKLVQAIRDDSGALADDVAKLPRAPVADVMSLADAVAKKPQPSAADVGALADALANAVAAYRTDTLALADDLWQAVIKRLEDDYLWIREEQNLTPKIDPWSEAMNECSGFLWGDPTKTNGQNVLNVGGNWRAAMHYSEATAYCMVGTDGGLFGDRYLRIFDDPSHTWKAFVANSGWMPVTPGKWYRISVYARSDANRGAAAYLTYHNLEPRLQKWVSWGISELGPGKGWVRKEGRLFVPLDAAATTVGPYLYGHNNHNGTVAHTDFDGYRIEGPFDADPGPILDSPAKSTGKVGTSSSLVADAISVAATFRGSAADTTTLADAIAARTGLGPVDALPLADVIIKAAGVSWTDVVTALDAIAAAIIRGADADAVALADAMALKTARTAADTADLMDTLASQAQRPEADVLTLSDAIVKAISQSVSDLLTVADALSAAATFLKSESDAASASDAVDIASVVRRTLSDIAALADAIRAAVAAQKPLPASFGGGAFDESVFDGVDGEMAALSDELTLRTIFGALATDLLDLADAIQYEARLAKADTTGLTDANQARINKEATDSATVADALALAVQSAKTDSLVLADAIIKAANAVAADPVALADSWATVVRAAVEDVAALADAVSTAADFRGSASDIAALVDALGKFVRIMAGEDTAALTDALAGFWFGKSAADAASLLDAVIAAIRATATDALDLTDSTNVAAAIKKPAPGSFGAGQFDDSMFDAPEGDPVALTDSLTWSAVYKRFAEDLAELADAVAAQVRARVADVEELADQQSARMASTQDDLITVADALLRVVATQLADNTGLTDSIRYGLARALTDLLAASDTLDQAAVTKAVADVLAFSDEELAKVGTSREDLLALADLLAALTGVPKADSTSVADEIVAALHLARQAEDFLGLMDSLMKRLQVVLETDVELEDDLVKGMKSAQEEALDLFEAIGAGVARPLPDDAVGILDEKHLRVALGLESAVGEFSDSTRVVVKQVLSQVWINGLNVPVTGLQITHSSTNRVSECRFSIFNPSAEVLGLAVPRADVKVYLVDGGHTEYFGGRIVDNPVKARSNTGVQLDVTVLDYTAAASDVFVTEVFTEVWTDEGLETPNKSLITILKEIWQRYYPYPINLDQAVTTGDRTLPKIVFKYDTLFEATERIARLLGGWSWFVEWDGGQHILRFFPLQGNIKDTVFSVANRNIVAGTARFGQDSRLCNAITVIGGSMLSEVRNETWVADGVKTMYQIPKNWREVSVKVDGVPQTKGAFYLHDKWAYDCLHDPEGVIVWREDNKPAQGALIEWTFRYERPVMAYLEDPTSIRQFGRVEERVVNSKIQDPVLARQLARQTIKERAFPVGYGAMEILESRVRAGDFVKVDLPKYNAQGYYEIKEVERKVVGSRIKRTIALGLASDPYHLIAERIREIMGRLAELEQRELGEDAELMRVSKYAEGAEIVEVVVALKETPEGVWRFGDSAARFGYSEWV